MIRSHSYSNMFFLGLLGLLFIGTPAFGGLNFPTAINVAQSIYFQKPDGEPVQLKPGVYEVAERGEKNIVVTAIGTALSKPIVLQAIPAGHEEVFEEASAELIPSPDNKPDKRHLLLLLPNGLALEAVGSYSGVFTRSASTWSTKVEDKTSGDLQEPLTLEIDEAIYFKTVGGDPQGVQPGSYEVTQDDDGLILTPAGDTTGEVIHVEPESLGTSAAVMLPEFDDNPDLELLMLGTASGQSLVAIGSHSGTFPRGFFKKFGRGLKKLGGKIKKGATRVGGGIKKGVRKTGRGIKKGAKFAHGKVGRHIVKYAKRGARHVKKGARIAGHHVKKHGRRVVKGAYKVGKGVAKETWKYCTGSVSGAHTCIKVGMKVAAVAS